MGRGRKPKPAKIHKMQGTYRADRHGDADVGLEVEKPKCPSYLPAKARTAFKEMRDILADEMGVLTVADRWVLEMTADAWNDYREAQRKIAKEEKAPTYETYTNEGSLMIRKHPLVAIRNDAWRRVKSGLADLGLTPAERTNVSKAINNKISEEHDNKKAKNW